MQTRRRLLSGWLGATPIEYGLIAALVSVAVIATLSTLGATLDTALVSIEGCLENPHAC